ncbi:MAG: hypothetical protein ACRDD1_12765, partial [Planctomycetia bacterium]
ADLTQQLQKSVVGDQAPPNLKELAAEEQRVERNLETLKDRLAALTKARQSVDENPQAAVAELKEDLKSVEAGEAAAEVATLEDFVGDLKNQLDRLEADQKGLMNDAAKATDAQLPTVEQDQKGLEAEAAPALAAAEDLLNEERVDGLASDRMESPAGDDAAPAEAPADRSPAAKAAAKKAAADAARQEAFQPAIAKAAPKNAADAAPKAEGDAGDAKDAADAADAKDAADAGKGKPADAAPPKPSRGKPFPGKPAPPEPPTEAELDARREALGDRQEETLTDLEAARAALAMDRSALQDLGEQLREAMKQAAQEMGELAGKPEGKPEGEAAGKPEGEPAGEPSSEPKGEPGKGEPKPAGSEGAEGKDGDPKGSAQPSPLDKLLESEQLLAAREMARRMMEAKGKPSALAKGTPKKSDRRGEPKNQPSQNASLDPNLDGNVLRLGPPDPNAVALEIDMRSVLLKMKPKEREELLKGMNEEGPESYRRFIQDYYRRLSRVEKK